MKLKSVFFIILLSFFALSSLSAKTKKTSKKAKQKYSKAHKGFKKKKKKYRGSGLDLKAITTDPAYKEDPQNGVLPIEKKE